MHDFWNQVILDNPVSKYVYIAIAILLAFTVKRVLSKYVAGLFHRMVERFSVEEHRTSLLKLIRTPLETFLMAAVTIAALGKLKFPEVLDFEIYDISSKVIVHALAKAIIIICFFWVLLRSLDFVAMILEWKANATEAKRDNQLIVFFRDFLKVIVGFIGLLMVLGKAFGFHVENIWTGLGIAGAALALATKESIENLIGSFIIFFDKPFTTGDTVKVNNISGIVERIGLRSVRIRTDLKTYVTVPNKQMVDSIVDNQTLRTQRKAEIRLLIGLSTSPGQIRQLIEGIKKILEKDIIENSTAFLSDITPTAFQVNVDFFTPPIALREFNEIKEKVNLEILQLMDRLDVQIAGASTDINISNKTADPVSKAAP